MQAGPAPGAKPAAGASDIHAEVLVLGAGPGGYTAAFRAADLGKKVVLVERRPSLGGVCLNVGCIPSKALLHAAKVITETEEMGAHGIRFAKPEVDIDALRGWKDGVVKKLTGGLGGLARQRKVQVVHGTGHFTAPDQVLVEGDDGTQPSGPAKDTESPSTRDCGRELGQPDIMHAALNDGPADAEQFRYASAHLLPPKTLLPKTA